MGTRFLWFTLLLFSIEITAQSSDSLSVSTENELPSLEINAYFRQQPLLGLTSSGATITTETINAQQTTTLLPALNTLAGVRMEERSPGSYRLAVRGSLIRSPFGVRNVKIYIDELPLTDAGGNTYLNLIDPVGIASMHLLKGPDGSLYGAHSNGVLRIQPKGFYEVTNQQNILLSGGSFGLFQEQLSVQHNINDRYSFSVDQSYTRSDGYRAHSAMEKFSFQTAHRWRYNDRSTVKAFILLTDLDYQTPGGLTEAQMIENQKMSRPQAGNNPSAIDQKAAIYNKTIFGGLVHETHFSPQWSHTLSLFGSHTNFENPFITNYEFRTENNLGIRTYLSYTNENQSNLGWEMQLGFEGQTGSYSIKNYDNNEGTVGDPQAFDDLNNTQNSLFYRAKAFLYRALTIEGTMGVHQFRVGFQQQYPQLTIDEGTIKYDNILMPRLAASYLLNDQLALRASISKGYSPPTIAELRSSDNEINTKLQAETGINYETGLRFESRNRRTFADLSLYHYAMKNGIVRQLRENGAEYYVNSGEMTQKGVEVSFNTYLLPHSAYRLITSIHLQSAVSYNHYRFGNYRVSQDDFSYNKVTAVPDWVWTSTLSVNLSKLRLNIWYNYTSEMPLNDANTAHAAAYHLVKLKTLYQLANQKCNWTFFVGVDNVLNEKYSLGNDINAFGNRFYNPAPSRNFYIGLQLKRL